MKATETKDEIHKIIDLLPEDKLTEALIRITALQVNHDDQLIDDVIKENSESFKRLAE